MTVDSLNGRIGVLENNIKKEQELLEESGRIVNVFLLHENTDPQKNFDGYNGTRHNNSFVVALGYTIEDKVSDITKICEMKDTVIEMKKLYAEKLKAKLDADKQELDRLYGFKKRVNSFLDKLEQEKKE